MGHVIKNNKIPRSLWAIYINILIFTISFKKIIKGKTDCAFDKENLFPS